MSHLEQVMNERPIQRTNNPRPAHSDSLPLQRGFNAGPGGCRFLREHAKSQANEIEDELREEHGDQGGQVVLLEPPPTLTCAPLLMSWSLD